MERPTYAQGADALLQALEQKFWLPKDVMYAQRVPQGEDDRFMYWWHAHAIDVLLDAYLRTQDASYLARAKRTLEGVIAHNKGTLLNNWYDDMEWMALAMLRMWDITQEDSLLKRIRFLWQDIQTAWNDHMGGGLAWRKDQLDYKNTPANAPAAILGLRLYRRFGDKADLEWGCRIYEWNRDNLMDPKTYYVYDGMNRQGDGKIDYDWDFSYCQGVMIGAAVEMYAITGEPQHLDLARNIALATLSRVAAPHGGMMPYEGKDDCGLFRGIYFRYLAELIQADPNTPALADMLAHNADVILREGMSPEGLVGGQWTSPPAQGEPVDLAQHLSAVMVVEMADRVLREEHP